MSANREFWESPEQFEHVLDVVRANPRLQDSENIESPLHYAERIALLSGLIRGETAPEPYSCGNPRCEACGMDPREPGDDW